jgi:hypothetical protein
VNVDLERKRSWSNLIYCLGICVEELRKITKLLNMKVIKCSYCIWETLHCQSAEDVPVYNIKVNPIEIGGDVWTGFIWLG